MKILLLLTALVGGRMLRHQGITEVSLSGSVTSGANGFSSGTISLPIGNAAPVPVGTPSPYQTYSAAWNSNLVVDWTPMPNAFVFDTANIAKLAIDQMGPNFQFIRTAQPTYTR